MRLAIVCPAWPPVPGGLSDYTAHWTQAVLGETGDEAVVLAGPGALGPGDGPLRVIPGRTRWGPDDLVPAVRALRADVVVVQYVPHLYDRRGLSLGIARAVARLGREGQPVVTAAHELYYGRHEGLRHLPAGLVQRAALWPLFAGSRRVVFSVPNRQARMAAIFPWWADRFATIPVGPNLWPPAGADPAAWRAAHGIAADEVVLLFQGGLHPSKEVGSVMAALDALAAGGIAARLVMIGGGRLDHPRALTFGHLTPAEAGTALAAADLALAPYDDGASGRRGSIMNALAAGLATVSTHGANTDPALFPPDAIRLVPPGDPAAFAAAVVELARDPAARGAMGDAARALHDAHFAWPVLARAWRPLLASAAGV